MARVKVEGKRFETAREALCSAGNGETPIAIAGLYFVVAEAEARRLSAEGCPFAYLAKSAAAGNTYRIVTIPINCDPYPPAPFEEPSPVDEADLFEAIRDNLSPQAVAAVVTYLKAPATANEEVNRQLRWFADELTGLLGGADALAGLAEEIGL